MQEALKQKQKLRLAVLHKLYEMSESDVPKFVNGGELYEACKASDEGSFKSAVTYLEGEHLVEVKWVQGASLHFFESNIKESWRSKVLCHDLTNPLSTSCR